MLTKNLKEWMSPQAVNTPMLLVPAFSEVRHDPYGIVLVIAPFNYPFQVMPSYVQGTDRLQCFRRDPTL